MFNQPLIEVRRVENTKVELQVFLVPFFSSKYWSFHVNCGSDWAAWLLEKHLKEFLGTFMQSERERWYNRGWRDAKSHHTPKRKYFCTTFGRADP